MAYGRRRTTARRAPARRSYSTRRAPARRSSRTGYAARKPRRVNRSVRAGSKRASVQTVRLEIVQAPAGNPLADRMAAMQKLTEPRKAKF